MLRVKPARTLRMLPSNSRDESLRGAPVAARVLADVFGVGELDLADGGFNAGHLREHMATGTAIHVEFPVAEGEWIAGRLTDAE